ncbi:MAG: metallophosphoesterase family protein [Deltaproteobacteria bacterium]|nr:metallophosphoesterase family protein [Deltaproteobacteria bacterium]MBN2845261.1 metallophosphoesterase family protein [Deltaproteobacteria bacterium]
MRLGIISDTHCSRITQTIQSIADRYLADVDLIIHAGDIVEADVLDVFTGTDIYAVTGNMDMQSVRRRFPQKLVLEIGGHRIGIIHGWGAPFGIEEKLVKEFDNIDCLIYGHTHHAVHYEKDGIVYFNPGSPTDSRFGDRRTVGIIEIDDGGLLRGQIIELP